MPAFDFFDSKEVEWQDGEIYFSGAKTEKITRFGFRITKDLEYLFAGGSEALSIQNGNKQRPFSIGLLKGAVDALNDAAIAAGGEDATDIKFDVVYRFKANGQRRLRTITLSECQIGELPMEWQQNDKKMEILLTGLALRSKFA